MYNLYSKLVKILEICKQFSEDLANEPRPTVNPYSQLASAKLVKMFEKFDNGA